MSIVEPVPEGVRLRLHIQPRAATTEIAGVHGDALKIRLAAPPIDGAANEELVRFLASILSVPTRHVEVVAGFRGRRKIAVIHGITEPAAAHRLGLIPGSK